MSIQKQSEIDELNQSLVNYEKRAIELNIKIQRLEKQLKERGEVIQPKHEPVPVQEEQVVIPDSKPSKPRRTRKRSPSSRSDSESEGGKGL